MLTETQMELNKQEYISLLRQINIPEANIEGLITFLEGSDFFEAPASTKYHSSHAGGLCEHSLNVYKTMCNLYDLFKYNIPEIEHASILITGLLHDISKVNYYEKYCKNEKVYSEKGLKSDNLGRFDWFTRECFTVKEPKNRFLCKDHETNSMILVSRYIPLSMEETVAILNHHGGIGDKNDNWDLSIITDKNPLLALLHAADYLSTFVLENME